MTQTTLFPRRAFLRATAIGVALGATGQAFATAAAPATSAVRSGDLTRIVYQAQGQGDVALVFIHGWSCDASYWAAQPPAFAQDFRVVTLDLAGHGASGASRKNWSIEAFADDVVSVLGALPQRRVILIGHSMGGPVALEAARRAPDRVVGVIGVDTLSELAEAPASAEAIEQFMAGLRADSAAATRDLVTEVFFQPDSDPALVKRIVDDMASAPAAVSVPSMDALLRFDPRPVARQLTIPITAINTGPPMDEAAARRIAPQFRLVTMTDLGHFPQLEAPARFNAALRAEVDRMLTSTPQR